MTSLVVSWVVFPLLIAALAAGWGSLIERLSGCSIDGVLLLPVGLAAVTVMASLATAFADTAQFATPVVGVGAVAGLLWSRPWRRVRRGPATLAVAVLAVYGAPVLLSGQATFTGYLRLDDTAAWFGAIDHVMAHGRSVAGMTPSTFTLFFQTDIGKAYPLGAFTALGAARGLIGTDVAWLFQPYLACCGAALALALLALVRPLAGSRRRAAVVAGLGAVPALLYGYSLWGGIKEVTAAWLLATGVALLAPVLSAPPARGRELLPVATCSGALLLTLGPGAAAWLLPAIGLVVVCWARASRRRGQWKRASRGSAWLIAGAAACAVPVWLSLATFLKNDQGLFAAGQSEHTRLGNLFHPLSGFQLAGVWTSGDFRTAPPFIPTGPLVALVGLAALLGVALSVRRHRPGVAVYVGIAMLGCAVFALVGATPWATAKALAISSPALLTAALAATLVLPRRRLLLVPGALIAAGVLASVALAYRDTTLAPRDRLQELEHIGRLVDGKGPTLLNAYDVYATRHFLRAGAPVEPADFRADPLPLRSGAVLTKAATADLDSYAPATLTPYRSLVVPRSPTASDPPSNYRLTWRGRFYELWQRRDRGRLLSHLALGDQRALPFCGNASNTSSRPLCPLTPVAVPRCAAVQRLARLASAAGGTLVADARALTISARGDDVLWPGRWWHDPAGHTLTPTVSGTATMRLQVPAKGRYELWLGGSFSRGFEVSVDGRRVGSVRNALSEFAGSARAGDVDLLPGVHVIALHHPGPGLRPGSGENSLTRLDSVSLVRAGDPSATQLRVAPADAAVLCGRPLDWIDVVS